jgi:hypothetical protein
MKIRVKLGLGDTTDSLAVTNGGHYVECMTGNQLFIAAYIVAKVLKVKDAVVALDKALKAPVSSTKTDNIKKARSLFDIEVTSLAGMVEDVANDPSLTDEDKTAVVHSAGMEVWETATPQKHTFKVKQGETSGSVIVYAKGKIPAHLVCYTEDVVEFKNRSEPIDSTSSIIPIEGLKKNTEYAFFHKAIKPKVKCDWEGPIIKMVL